MDTWIEFDVTYRPSSNRVTVFLVEGNTVDGRTETCRTLDIQMFYVFTWWHSLSDIESKINATKRKMYENYKKTRHLTLAVQMVADFASKGRVMIRDSRTAEFIENIKKKFFGEKAKVIDFPVR